VRHQSDLIRVWENRRPIDRIVRLHGEELQQRVAHSLRRRMSVAERRKFVSQSTLSSGDVRSVRILTLKGSATVMTGELANDCQPPSVIDTPSVSEKSEAFGYRPAGLRDEFDVPSLSSKQSGKDSDTELFF
jgi:hypothetical protein